MHGFLRSLASFFSIRQRNQSSEQSETEKRNPESHYSPELACQRIVSGTTSDYSNPACTEYL